MMRLYTEEELGALRNIDMVKGRLDAAVAAYKALYHSLDSIENVWNGDSIREARRGICDVMSRMSADVRDLMYSESERIMGSVLEFPEVADIEERIRVLEDSMDDLGSEGRDES